MRTFRTSDVAWRAVCCWPVGVQVLLYQCVLRLESPVSCAPNPATLTELDGSAQGHFALSPTALVGRIKWVLGNNHSSVIVYSRHGESWDRAMELPMPGFAPEGASVTSVSSDGQDILAVYGGVLPVLFARTAGPVPAWVPQRVYTFADLSRIRDAAVAFGVVVMAYLTRDSRGQVVVGTSGTCLPQSWPPSAPFVKAFDPSPACATVESAFSDRCGRCHRRRRFCVVLCFHTRTRACAPWCRCSDRGLVRGTSLPSATSCFSPSRTRRRQPCMCTWTAGHCSARSTSLAR
jgi:hypothetical protein